jgi:hypothetical protein
MRREVRGRQGNTTWFARRIMTFQGHRDSDADVPRLCLLRKTNKIARISSLSNEVGLYVVLLEVLLFMPNSLIRHSK